MTPHIDLRGSMVITREIGDRGGEAIACWNLGDELAKLDRLAEAIPLMEVCVRFEQEIGHPDADKDAALVTELRQRPAGRSLRTVRRCWSRPNSTRSSCRRCWCRNWRWRSLTWQRRFRSSPRSWSRPGPGCWQRRRPVGRLSAWSQAAWRLQPASWACVRTSPCLPNSTAAALPIQEKTIASARGAAPGAWFPVAMAHAVVGLLPFSFVNPWDAQNGLLETMPR